MHFEDNFINNFLRHANILDDYLTKIISFIPLGNSEHSDSNDKDIYYQRINKTAERNKRYHARLQEGRHLGSVIQGYSAYWDNNQTDESDSDEYDDGKYDESSFYFGNKV